MKLRLDSLPLGMENTVLRRMKHADLPIFHAYRSDTDLARYQGWSAMSLQDAQAFIQDAAVVETLKPGGWIQLAIADEATDSILGDVGLYVDEVQNEAEVGFTLRRSAQGAGHATRAVRAAVALLLQTTSVARVRAVTDARNEGSIGVLGRAGFCKTRERRAVFKGEACLELIYVLPRSGA